MQTIPIDVHFLPDADHLCEYERTVLVAAQRRVVKILFATRGSISISEILRLTNISLNSLVSVFATLSKNNCIERTEAGLQLTANGRRWSIKNRKAIFMHKEQVLYRSVADQSRRKSRNFSETSVLPRKYLFTWVDMRENGK